MPTWDDVVAIGETLAEVEVTTSYKTPALKVRGKLLVRLRSDKEGALAVVCTPEEKAAYLHSGDPALFTLPHYDGHGYILVNLDLVEPELLGELIQQAWWLRAPAALRREIHLPDSADHH